MDKGQEQGAGSGEGTSKGSHSSVIKEYLDAQAANKDMAVAVAAIKALTSVIKNSRAQTMMGLGNELKEAAAALQRTQPTNISLRAGCELFLRYTTRTSALEMDNFAAAKDRLIKRGNHFAETSIKARQRISELGAQFVRDGSVVLTHGLSKVILELLQQSVKQGKKFSVIVTENSPHDDGKDMAKFAYELGVPVTVIRDCAVASVMERVDIVLVEAEGVVENGGIMNKLGTYMIAIIAKAFDKPFMVVAESYNFHRLYPLNQKDLPVEQRPWALRPLLPVKIDMYNPSGDFTPPDYISLLITDLGVKPPAAVSDELIELYS